MLKVDTKAQALYFLQLAGCHEISVVFHCWMAINLNIFQRINRSLPLAEGLVFLCLEHIIIFELAAVSLWP